jgi:hypothetical protein
MQSICKLLPLLSLLAAVSACGDLTGAGGKRRLGILQWEQGGAGRSSAVLSLALTHDPTVVSAPDTVRAGESFKAVITTTGPTPCWETAGEDVQRQPRLAIVTPYDRHRGSEGTRCGDMEVRLTHTVQIRFLESGEAILRVHGRKIVGANPNQPGTPMTVEKKIFVR